MLRKIRSDTQMLHLHMTGSIRIRRASPGLAWPMLRRSGVLGVVHYVTTTMLDACARLARWAVGPVDAEHPTNVVPMPGPAHGPVPAIDIRREERRKAS